MDRKWMLADRLTPEYHNGVNEFIRVAVENAKNPEKILCPCTKCYNSKRGGTSSLRDHLIINGIDQLYTRWIWHGEEEHLSDNMDDSRETNDFGSDRLEEMARAVEENFINQPEVYDNLLRDAREPLNSSCTRFSRLSAVLRLYNLKAAHGWTDKSFTALLNLLKEMLPEDSVLPKSTYQAKKILCTLGLDYESIERHCVQALL